MSFKNELKQCREFVLAAECTNFKNKVKDIIRRYLKTKIQDINTIYTNKFNCSINIDTNLVKLSTDTVLDIIKQIFKELNIENDVSDINFKYDSNYQDSYYILTFNFMAE